MDDIKSWCQGKRDRLPELEKTEDLMYNWNILGTCYELIDLVGCDISDSITHKDIHIGIDAKIT